MGRWIHGPVPDTLLAFVWVPFAVVTFVVQAHPALLASLLSLVLVLSLSHQPVTLALVYGDRERFDAHRVVYLLAPVVVVGAVLAGLRVSFALVAIVAALWNAEHTIMQRYGVTRMYGRKAGDSHGPLERAMYISWLVVAAVFAGANPRTAGYLREVDLGDVNKRAITILTHLRPEATLLVLPALGAACVFTVRWVRAARAAAPNPGKWVYVAATAGLIGLICLDPVAGFAAYVSAHAVEYFVIVRSASSRRASAGEGGTVGAVVRRLGASRFVALVTIAAVVPLVLLKDSKATFTVVTATYLSVGALHIIYDGLIWKMRRPSVARDLAVGASA